MAKINLTPGRIASFSCDSGQSFLWDSTVHGLGVRVTANGNRAFVIQSRLNGKPLRVTIGNAYSITLEDARNEARKLLLMIEQGIDPRKEKERLFEEQKADDAAREQHDAREQVKTLKIADVWNAYIKERQPYWGHRHYLDHLRLSQSGETKSKKGDRNLKPGPLFPLMQLSLADITTELIEGWLKKESADRPSQTRLAYTALKTFLNWCGDHKDYQGILSADILTNKIRAILPKKKAKTDCIQREQLAGWFASVQQINNPVISAYLQALLITGARREELAGLRWEDVDFRWKSLTIKDKVEGQRVIPLTPYAEHLLNWLPKRNEWVFSSPTAASGRLQEPRIQHNKALLVAGIEGLTIHGLRRSFGTLAEWVEVPVGIVAQIMGHKPSATAEKHYRVRPLDLLRMWHVKIEEWILEQSGVAAPPHQEEQLPVRLATGR